MRNLVLCLALFAVPACNDDSLLGGMSDMTFVPDLTVVADLTMRIPDGVACGNMTCNSPQVCCVKQGASASCVTSGNCGDGGAEEMCDGPEDCPNASPNCCATAKFSQGAADAGPMAQGANASCGSDAQCPAGVDLNAGELHTKLCHLDADCNGYTGSALGMMLDFDGCCSSTMAPGVHFCAPKQFMGSRYTCP